MNIMDLFRSAPQTPNPVAQANPAVQANPNNPTQVNQPAQALPSTQQTTLTDANGVIPKQEEKKEVSPFDQFADVWKTAPVENPEAAMFAGLDPKKIMDMASKVDFTKHITPEILQKIQAGGQEGVSALIQALNSSNQQVYAQSALATTKILETQLLKERERIQGQIPDMVKRLTANEGLREANPIMNNPAVAPLVSALTAQLQVKNPNATSAEIQTQVTDYFNHLGNAFAPKPQETLAQKKAKNNSDFDFSSFLDS